LPQHTAGMSESSTRPRARKKGTTRRKSRSAPARNGTSAQDPAHGAGEQVGAQSGESRSAAQRNGTHVSNGVRTANRNGCRTGGGRTRPETRGVTTEELASLDNTVPLYDVFARIHAGEPDPFGEDDAEEFAPQVCRNEAMRCLLKSRPQTARQPAADTEELIRIDSHLPEVGDGSNTSPFLVLHNEILQTVERLVPSVPEQSCRHRAIARVEAAAQSIWPGCSVEVFGSYEADLSLYCSDVDLTVVNTGVGGVRSAVIDGLRQLGQALRARGAAVDVEVVKATVSILKFVDPYLGSSFDVCLNSPQRQVSRQLISTTLSTFPAFRPLFIVLKAYLVARDINTTFEGTCGSFLLFTLVLSYFERTADPTCSLGHHLFAFFHLYSSVLEQTRVGLRCSTAAGPGKWIPGGYFLKHTHGWQDDGRPDSLAAVSAVDQAVDLGGKAHRYYLVREAFLYGFRTLSWLVTANSAGPILIPHLLPSEHPLIDERDACLRRAQACLDHPDNIDAEAPTFRIAAPVPRRRVVVSPRISASSAVATKLPADQDKRRPAPSKPPPKSKKTAVVNGSAVPKTNGASQASIAATADAAVDHIFGALGTSPETLGDALPAVSGTSPVVNGQHQGLGTSVRVAATTAVVVTKSEVCEVKADHSAPGKKRTVSGGVSSGVNDAESEASEPRKKKAKKRKSGIKVKVAPIAEEVVPFTSLDATLQEQHATIPW